ncbi:MAG: tRNA (adenosine(37)-N6)-threonylcarbamoyltransferase complex ATPase subunit type 1 TsaE [Cycloclasticus sp.]|jgi:tRNA threonylcarbamoyladenosine biosynthesis protein TsaE|nr:MAG: tRNA threonylcarbamoyladenosine biosynthesis protein TsaE [Cycloclasticus sp. Phe_18]MBV1912509.1 tRNA (adenosine(37)-N6)-threonylcarbamoyltransferase complex ATPase subunit type 1 TsaE [Cycloclasticus sp.]MDF1690114.1 tRNA (adenosine(37)-N6)-threonylcarbamoyltransferase complex ATPase subunit type 1 TsaE [Cycloclasticus sp.]MEE4290430.1 tRNA (adenosine(37)-N6)-threonylcarbamoyltransferase complex ATPase subunit type 1 TsaE [Cycloclasticus sp.]
MIIKNEQDMLDAGEQLALELTPGMLVFLIGDLGAGKTTLVRGILKGLGHKGSVKSPTYNLVEPYTIKNLPVFHFDLYRLMGAEELEYMGMRDYLNKESICFVEWPEKGDGLLPKPDVVIKINIYGSERELLISKYKDS